MNGITLAGSKPDILLSHMALYGLLGILEQAGQPGLRACWTAGMNPRPRITGDRLTGQLVADAVLQHARDRQTDSWLKASYVDCAEDLTLKLNLADVNVCFAGPAGEAHLVVNHGGAVASNAAKSDDEGRIRKAIRELQKDPESAWATVKTIKFKGRDEVSRGLMSPRQTPVHNWTAFQDARHATINTLAGVIDHRLAAALGEPAYWPTTSRADAPRPDGGASPFEMAPRNSGAEIMTSRFAKMVDAIVGRTPNSIIAGLTGNQVEDVDPESDSRSATGFATPGPVDTALAWCALWGIANLPCSPRMHHRVLASAYTRIERTDYLIAAAWRNPWSPGRLRSVLASRQLMMAATEAITHVASSEGAADAWLAGRGVLAVITFAIEVAGSASAPERRALVGQYHSLSR
ncbi:MAG: hypothetical protein U0904_03380 [Candidatus Nanopelagicales bacterium]|nr:hypothetical protein [Candidatus Nanopelagicales bacterium]